MKGVFTKGSGAAEGEPHPEPSGDTESGAVPVLRSLPEATNDTARATEQEPASAPPQISYTVEDGRLTLQFPDVEAEELCLEWGDARILLSRDGRLRLQGRDVVVTAQDLHRVLAGRVEIN